MKITVTREDVTVHVGPWAPAAIRDLLVDLDLGNRCRFRCAPRLFTLGDMAWISTCGRRADGCNGGRSPGLFLALCHRRELPPEAALLESWGNAAAFRSMREAIDASIPLDGEPGDYAPIDDVHVARLLGADRWAVLGGDTLGLVGSSIAGPVMLVTCWAGVRPIGIRFPEGPPVRP